MALCLTLASDPRPIAKGLTSKTGAQLLKMSVTHVAGRTEEKERLGQAIMASVLPDEKQD